MILMNQMMGNKTKVLRAAGLILTSLFLGLNVSEAKEIPANNEKAIEKRVKESSPEIRENAQYEDRNKTIIGAVEKVRILPGNIVLKARIDTGATTTSLGVDEMELIHEDGKDWVEIRIGEVTSKYRVVKFIRIKQHESESVKRPVVRLRLILGNVSESVNVTLADRSKFKYKLLIGRNLLYDNFIVDVSQKYTIDPMEHKEE